MSNITPVQFGKRAPENLASDLRALADAVDRGEVVEFEAVYVNKAIDEIRFVHASSFGQAIILTQLMARRAVDNFME